LQKFSPSKHNLSKNVENRKTISHLDDIKGNDVAGESIKTIRLPAVGTLKRYSKALEYEYRVKTAALGTLKRYSILSLTLYLE
jgi:hypothetical protein